MINKMSTEENYSGVNRSVNMKSAIIAGRISKEKMKQARN